MAEPEVNNFFSFPFCLLRLARNSLANTEIQNYFKETNIGVIMALQLKVDERTQNKGLMEPTTVAKIKFFYKLMEKLGLFQSYTSASKNNHHSKMLREAGNQMFVMKDAMYEAMKIYNMAICMAKPDNGDALSIAYANRSAVLFEWKEYNLCRENIALAKAAGCPDGIMKKLNIRDVQCLSMLNMPMKATEEPEILNIKAESVRYITMMKGGKKEAVQMNIVENNNPDINQIVPHYNYFKYRGEPCLSMQRNSQIPFAANCLEIQYELQNGRHIVTNDDLKPGQIVVIENSFVDAPTTQGIPFYRYTKCANCYKENLLCLIPCPSCTVTMFCSEKCLVESKPYHGIECPISDLMLKFAWSDTLAIRMTLKAYAIFKDTNHLNGFCNDYDDF